MSLVLVKLGGSLITDKRRPQTARPRTLRRLAAELAQATAAAARAGRPLALLVGHGSGSFGHVAADRAGLGRGPLPPHSAAGVAATQAAARALHGRVVAALAAAGLPAFSLSPGSFLVTDAGRLVACDPEPAARALDLGLLPVVYGDVVLDRTWGAAIASTETVLAALAERLPALGHPIARALWLGETAGLLDGRGRLVPEISAATAATARRHAGDAAGTDVTGGMRHRLDTALALAAQRVESLLLDGTVPGRLEKALAGEGVRGTRVRPR